MPGMEGLRIRTRTLVRAGLGPRSRFGARGRDGLGFGPAARRNHPRCFADVAQLVEHHLAKVRVAGSNPVVRSKGLSGGLLGGVAERRGNGLQSRVHGFKSRLHLGDPSSSAPSGELVRDISEYGDPAARRISPRPDPSKDA